MTIEIKPLTGCIGAEVFGADVGNPDHFGALMEAFATHAVIGIRDQEITPVQQLAFARRFVQRTPFSAAMPRPPRHC